MITDKGMNGFDANRWMASIAIFACNVSTASVNNKRHAYRILSMHALSAQGCSAVCVKGLTINYLVSIIDVSFSHGK